MFSHFKVSSGVKGVAQTQQSKAEIDEDQQEQGFGHPHDIVKETEIVLSCLWKLESPYDQDPMVQEENQRRKIAQGYEKPVLLNDLSGLWKDQQEMKEERGNKMAHQTSDPAYWILYCFEVEDYDTAHKGADH